MRIPRVLAEGLGFTEGPTLTRQGTLVVVSISQGVAYALEDPEPRVVGDFGGGPNGATADSSGHLFVAQNGGNWLLNPDRDRIPPGMTGGVQILHTDGEIAWLTRQPSSPNDICFGPDGLLYVTDPARDGRFDDSAVWRVHPESGEIELLMRVPWFANGIAFGPDDALWIASTGDSLILRMDPGGLDAGALEPVCDLSPLRPDGFAFDIEGHLVVGALSYSEPPSEVQVWSAEGRLLDRLQPGPYRHYTNVALSGDHHLIVTDSDGGRVLCYDGWPHPGLALHPLRDDSILAPPLPRHLKATEQP